MKYSDIMALILTVIIFVFAFAFCFAWVFMCVLGFSCILRNFFGSLGYSIYDLVQGGVRFV